MVAAQHDGDVDGGLVLAGQCAAAIHDIVGVQDLLAGMVRQATELLVAAGAADIPGTETFPPPQVEPLIVKSWHSSTDVLPKSSDSNAVYALHADGTGEAPQFNAPFWVFVAFVRMVNQSDAFNDVVKTLDGVSVATPARSRVRSNSGIAATSFEPSGTGPHPGGRLLVRLPS